MNILRITTLFVPPWKGLGPGPYELSKAQAGLGDNVTVYTRSITGNGDSIECICDRYTVIRLSSISDLDFSLKVFLRTWKDIKNKEYDIIHSHGYSALFNLLFTRSIPIVSHAHISRNGQLRDNSYGLQGGWLERLKFLKSALFERIYLRLSSHIFAVSSDVKNEIARISTVSVTVVHNGYNPNVFFPTSDNREIDILFVGGLNSRKGEDILVDALAALGNKFKTCVIVGEGPNRANLELKINEISNPQRVSLLANINNEELSSIMRKSKCLVLLSKSEGLPKVLVESAACGVVPILSDIPTHIEFLGENLSKRLCIRRDKNDLIGKLNEIQMNWNELNQEILVRVERYNWRHIAQEIRKIYVEL